MSSSFLLLQIMFKVVMVGWLQKLPLIQTDLFRLGYNYRAKVLNDNITLNLEYRVYHDIKGPGIVQAATHTLIQLIYMVLMKDLWTFNMANIIYLAACDFLGSFVAL